MYSFLRKYFQVGDDFEANLKEKASSGDEFLVKDTMADFMMDAIASCGFGVEANALKDENNSPFKHNVRSNCRNCPD